MSPSLYDLESAWATYEPAGQRPLGGRRALAGFDYQLSLSLASFVERVLRRDADVAHAFEGLSDLSESRDGLLCVSQVKLSLDAARLREAYDEFLIVDQFLEEKFPQLQHSCRYQVFTKRIRSDPGSQLEEFVHHLSVEQAARWMALRERILPHEVRADPSLELAIRLWGHVASPLSTIAKLRGLLLQRLATNTPSSQICLDLLEVLNASPASTKPPGQLLSPGDFEPVHGGEVSILVGQRPNPRHVAQGCFMERRSPVELVLKHVNELLKARSRGAGGNVAVVWIAGGSGAGKSVVLLQALERLLDTTDLPVHWLGHLVGNLPEALTFWRTEGRSAVIAVDDIYAPYFRGGDLWRRIHEALASSPPVIVLTCGPSDYKDAFDESERAYHEDLDIRTVELPPLDDDERHRFSKWFATRSGTPVGPPLKERNIMVATFLLERRRRGDPDLTAFTARFRERLVLYDLLSAFLVALASNRLGMHAPMPIFKGRGDALKHFVDDGLCQLHEVPDSGERVLWFHPILADEIYEKLVTNHASEERAAHLSCLFDLLLDEPDAAESLLMMLQRTHRRLDRTAQAAALVQIGEHLADRMPPDLKIWLTRRWQAAARKRRLPVERILPKRRLQTWMNSDGVDPTAWALLFQMLWERLDQRERADEAERAFEWLSAHSDCGAWTYIWRLLWEGSLERARLVSLARSWLAPNSDKAGWTYVFQDLFNSGIRDPWLRDAAAQGLEKAPFTIAEPYLWEKARDLGVPPELLAKLLTTRLCRSFIPRTTSRGAALLLKWWTTPADHREVLAALDGARDLSGWPHVALCLLESQPEWAELRTVCRTWLGGREERAEWNYLWQRLLLLEPESSELRTLGASWLAAHTQHPGATAVRSALFQARRHARR